MRQITNHILMIRPAHFGYNEETAQNNAFQTKTEAIDFSKLEATARQEFDQMVDLLQSKGINVIVIEDTDQPVKPDAVFPNNWISFHENGSIITYPMYAKNRRIERREDIIEKVGQHFNIKNRYSFEFYEDEDLFLEGTGSMILDRPNKIVYACLSPRTDATLIDKFNVLMGYRSCIFRSVDRSGKDIYHTNVMMALGEDFVVICMESIPDEDSRKELRSLFENTGKQIIEINYAQMEAFAGNMLEVLGSNDKRYLVMSRTAYDSLTNEQIQTLSALTNILAVPIPNIEKHGGGSVRCMMAEIFLPEK
ncbi:MAG: amidinotransferase [Saprospiraceae bacterium]|nr:amidinotransferase [Saprospiraceae bacterium]